VQRQPIDYTVNLHQLDLADNYEIIAADFQGFVKKKNAAFC